LPPWPRPRPTSMRLAARGLARDTAALTALAGALPAGRGDASWLARLADRLVPAGGWVEHPATWLVAADLSTGARIAFGSPGAPRISLGDALRASWAVPGWFPPVVTGGLRLADGGIVSTASADLLLPRPPREVLVFAPMASAQPGRRTGLGRIEQQLRRVMTRGLDAEVDALRAAGSRVIRVEPGPEDLAAMGAYLMDRRRRRRVLDTSLRTSTATLRQIVAASNDGTDEGALA
ncbi:patatin-like phospholipase family protein, partial [Kribbella sp. NPDC006257]|uniref:patatin-like phospholipase family protein n=1 Tax=Kribbella sp. NPDC006257 TaxID=3156738 RepID=UPI0033A094B7